MMSAVITVRIQNETEWRMERIRMSGRLKYLFIYLLGVGGIMRNLSFPAVCQYSFSYPLTRSEFGECFTRDARHRQATVERGAGV